MRIRTPITLESRMRTTRTSLLASAGAGALLLLTACSGSPATEPAPTTTGSTDASATESPDEPGEEPAPDADATGAECLVGEWEMDLTATGEMLAMAMSEGSATDATVEVDGEGLITYDGSTMTSQWDQQTMAISMAVDAGDGTDPLELVVEMLFDGSATADYTATDTEIRTSNPDASGLEIAVETSVGGMAIDVPGIDELSDPSMFETESVTSYECSGDELRLTEQVEGVDDVPTQVLTRRS